MATKSATWAYRDRFHESFARAYFRRFADCLVSSVGVGTYLGDATDTADERYHDAIVEALENGINVVDTAVNYRHQRSERTVGRAIDDADVDREAVMLSTKGGFVPFDGERPADASAYIESEFLDTGLIDRDDLVMGNCLSPDFLGWSLDRSLANLDVETVDLYYVHNPEAQLARFDHETVYDKLEDAFTRLEERAAAGDIRHYGVATWEAFRVPEDHEKYLSLSEVVARAQAASDRAGTNATHFRALQLPFNVHMADGFTLDVHEGAEERQSVLRVAHEAGLDVFTSASILQGDLAEPGGIPEAVDAKLSGDTPAQRAINFARSAPGVTCSLVGTGTPEHVSENIAAGTFEPMGADAFDAVFE
ncbi:MAG: aryl-alcohol dehydrogenase-like predicted oxidoreductase [Natronomonas sp.]|jgi:aryl-alcohol dehydrogenase-like predicted oxidoreductase|uniref:aldo/keto reductase n=1 Tax=Natronomonas sp. TaxID=2184060 RepID=UPI003989D789